jgi:hypothetical protein
MDERSFFYNVDNTIPNEDQVVLDTEISLVAPWTKCRKQNRIE